MKAPTTAQLVQAVRERMDTAIEHPVGGFEARVIRNVLAIVERELDLGPDVDQRRQALLAEYESADEEALAALIRAGSLDESADRVRAQLLDVAEAQLAIDNPRWT